MRRAGRFFASLSCAALLCCGASAPAWADSAFTSSPHDVAQAWLDLLFRGIGLPPDMAAGAPHLDAIAGALHRALGVYSMSILVLAGLLLFYNIAVMIVETAHYGIPLGRRSAQVWAPFRLVLAIGLLVPVSGGLNAGQYLVTWMAEQGSSLASNAWSVAVGDMKGSFSGIAVPEGPDVAGFVAGGLDMELCRSLYRRAYNALPAAAPARIAGDMGEIEKLPHTRFAGDSWLYSNHLHAGTPLCGAYLFAAAHPQAGDTAVAETVERLNGEVADFSRSETDKLISETQSVADANASIYLGDVPGPGPHDEVAALIASHASSVEERLHALVTGDPGVIDRTLAASADAGWITAGGFLLELARLQELYGTLAAHLLPSAEVPLLAAGGYLHPRLTDMIAADPTLQTLSEEQAAPISGFYQQTARTVRRARDWLYDRQLADMPLMLADPFDLRDETETTNGPAAVSSLFGHVVNDAAIANGVWNAPLPASASPLALDSDQPVLAMPSAFQNPLMALADFGQRQAALGNYLLGIAGPDIAPPGTLAHALLLGAAGLLFLASGFALMFLVPLLPFIRFFVGILAWLLSVFEAVIAVPIVALAHVNFSGEGLSGGAARQAYLLWLGIVVRPVLALFGLIAGLLLFTFAIAFLGIIFHHLMHLAAPAGSEGFVTVNLGLTFLYTVLALAAANMSFKGIGFLPEIAIKWLGGFVPAARADVQPAVASASAVSSAQALPNLSPGAPMLSPSAQSTTAASRSLESRLVAAARSGLAFFPQYGQADKAAADAGKSSAAVSGEKRDAASASNEALRVMPLHTLRDPLQRPTLTPDKKRKGNTDNLATSGPLPDKPVRRLEGEDIVPTQTDPPGKS
jgi:conjugal transfer/type IV secretion protein DotA/TraY